MSGILHLATNYQLNLSPSDYAKFSLPILYSSEWLNDTYFENGNITRKTNKDIVWQELEEKRKTDKRERWTGILGQILAVMSHYVSEERLQLLKESSIPVLIMTGTNDKLVKPENSYYLQQVLGAEMKVFEGAGHMIHRECHEQVNKALLLHFLLNQNRLKESKL